MTDLVLIFCAFLSGQSKLIQLNTKIVTEMPRTTVSTTVKKQSSCWIVLINNDKAKDREELPIRNPLYINSATYYFYTN